MRTACGDDAAGRKRATEADIHMMETKPEEWRANVCMAKSGTSSQLKQMRNTAFDFVRSFNTTAEVERAVIREEQPVYSKAEYIHHNPYSRPSPYPSSEII
jgi:hypothetical protein